MRKGAGATFYFEDYFPKYFVNFGEIKYFGESNYSSRSVFDMLHYYDKHGYSRGCGKNSIYFFEGPIIRGGRLFE